ncbi:MrcB family domain-containing protein [Candidatus Formimonas warabiya]|nr:DUF3578 domain-containing protein [Candidatus Formimonas warabiya]
MTNGGETVKLPQFYDYIGPENSLSGYQRSYKLVLMIAFLEGMDAEGKILLNDLARQFKEFYIERKKQGLLADINPDPAIANVEKASLSQIISVIRYNPLNAYRSKGILYVESEGNREIVVMDREIFSEITPAEKEKLISLLENKLKHYYSWDNQRENVSMDTDTFKGYLQKVMDEYLSASSQPFAGHAMGELLRKIIPGYIEKLTFINKSRYKVNGSIGKGSWTKYPWIAVLDRNITETTQNGVYIVYLFSEDMQRCYLTLNQGFTKLKNEIGKPGALKKMQDIKTVIRSKVDMRGFNTDSNITLGNEFYEQCTICYRLYQTGNLPHDRELISDLDLMMQIYKDYYAYCVGNKPDESEKPEIGETEKQSGIIEEPETPEMISDYIVKDDIDQIHLFFESKGFVYDKSLLKNFYLALKAKPFVILAGTSGTGKSRLVRLFAEALNATPENRRFKLIAVRPDWSDSTDLLGYRDLNGRFHPGPLTTFLNEARKNSALPYFLCLDEMNLARVEYYFSDVLSAMETRRIDEEGNFRTDTLISSESFAGDEEARHKYGALYLPDNVYIVGTVNMDETTFPFSKKVLDRANTIEFSQIDLQLMPSQTVAPVLGRTLHNSFMKGQFLTLSDCMTSDEIISQTIGELMRINRALNIAGLQVGYRIRDEVCFYTIYNEMFELLPFAHAMDFLLLQKILPRIQGSSSAIKRTLIDLFKICIGNDSATLNPEDISVYENMQQSLPNAIYRFSAEKLVFMMRRYEEDGFTSYWL